MENRLDCEIVRDLLPSYVDGLTSAVTNSAVESHINSCEGCSDALRRMREPEPQKSLPGDGESVDFLKKLRRRSTGKSLAVGVILMLVGLAIFSFRVFYVGSAADANELACHVSVSDGTVTVSGTLASSGLGVSRVTFSDSAGMVHMSVYTAPKAFFNSGDFEVSYTVPGPVGRVQADDLILWEEGTEISPRVSRLYAAQNSYVGDMPSNARIASILGISDRFGPFTNELQTLEEPYGWALLLETSISAAGEASAQEAMTACSCAMLASIGNLGYVTWQYDAGGAAREFTVTAEDASALAGGDIKSFSGSAADFQALLQSLGFSWAAVSE